MHMLGYFCATKQNKQILHKQYRFLYCAPIRMLKQKNLAPLFIDKNNKVWQNLKKKLGSTPKIRVCRVTGNNFFYFGLKRDIDPMLF